MLPQNKPIWDEIQFKIKIAQNWDKISYFPTQKWDKNKNNGFGFDGKNLIIKFNKMNQNQWNLIIKSPILQWNPDPNLSQIIANSHSKSTKNQLFLR